MLPSKGRTFRLYCDRDRDRECECEWKTKARPDVKIGTKPRNDESRTSLVTSLKLAIKPRLLPYTILYHIPYTIAETTREFPIDVKTNRAPRFVPCPRYYNHPDREGFIRRYLGVRPRTVT
eukprot:scaffold202_cov180-Amphora_coffeaeformis.AAC.15